MTAAEPITSRYPTGTAAARSGYVCEHNRHSSAFALGPDRLCWAFAQGGRDLFLELTINPGEKLWGFAGRVGLKADGSPATDYPQLASIWHRISETGTTVREIYSGGPSDGSRNNDKSLRVKASGEAPLRLLTLTLVATEEDAGDTPLGLLCCAGAVAELVAGILPGRSRCRSASVSSVSEAMNRR